jgi:hypothetical protein
MTEASLALTFDPKIFGLSAGDVRLGTIPTSGSGWALSTSVNSATGWIGIRLYSVTPIATSKSGSLAEITFHVLPGASASAATVQLVGSVQTGGQVVRTEVDDDQGAYTLSPTPTNAAPVSGVVVPAAAQATSDAGVSVGSEKVTPQPIEETVVVSPPANRGTENRTVVIQEESGAVVGMEAGTSIGSVEGNPSSTAPQPNVTLAAGPSGPSSSSNFDIFTSPSGEQVLFGADLWSRAASEQSNSPAPPLEGSQTSAPRKALTEKTESVDDAIELGGDAASRSAIFAAPALASRSRTASSALDELFASWDDRRAMLED